MNLTEDEKAQLQATLGCSKAELARTLDRYAEAAREEYVRMVLGQRVFTRGQDLLEYRLLLMVQHVFGGQLPSEQQISAVFQMTMSQSRTLLRSILAKYRYELGQATVTTIRRLLADARMDPDDSDVADDDEKTRLLTIDNTNVVEEMNRRIVSIDPSLPPLERQPRTGAVFKIKASSYHKLREQVT
jgi:hypothetical protein